MPVGGETSQLSHTLKKKKKKKIVVGGQVTQFPAVGGETSSFHTHRH